MGHALARQGNLGLDFLQGLRYIFCVLTAAIFVRRLRSGQVRTERSHRGLVRAFAKCLRLTTSVGSNPTLSACRGSYLNQMAALLYFVILGPPVMDTALYSLLVRNPPALPAIATYDTSTLKAQVHRTFRGLVGGNHIDFSSIRTIDCKVLRFAFVSRFFVLAIFSRRHS